MFKVQGSMFKILLIQPYNSFTPFRRSPFFSFKTQGSKFKVRCSRFFSYSHTIHSDHSGEAHPFHSRFGFKVIVIHSYPSYIHTLCFPFS
ncbi:MAG: hypothetical protein HUU43_01545 [Ignavibacteriaceae bacterium]|nr:hypothetical protein [Ignavibacteriaceae bacterium]